ncbi:MAG: GNAT family N-acetyltransferase [Bacillota bacterium]|nr:GNAT family N-acetyltransferase [Bacillota bacterium]
MADLLKIAPLFSGWEETMIWSCLQGCMGYATADDEENPSAALITVGDFCFLAGAPNFALVAGTTAPIIVPQNDQWGNVIECVWGNRVEKAMRYAIKKEPDIFDVNKLTEYSNYLPKTCALKLFDREIYEYSLTEQWSKDFCSQFLNYDDFSRRGLGVAVIYGGKPVSGASSYTVYNGGIEIEVDTSPEFRQKGFASACCAGLILECLKRGLYPSWDAHDLRSASLAQKLGYHLDHPYTVYIQK